MLWLLAFLLALATPAAAQLGGLSVAPTRVVFGDRDRTVELTLINRTDKETEYRISIVNRRMNEKGELEEVEAAGPGDQFADPYLRYSPRVVRIPAGGSQTVRVMKRLPADLASGEYRSHLLFQAVPDADATSSIDPDLGDNQIAIQLIPIYGVSIPVFIRHGDVAVTAVLENARLVTSGENAPYVALTIARAGNRSVSGHLKAVLVKGGKETEVGLASGIAVYSPNASRTAEIPIRPEDGVSLSGGTLRISYENIETRGEILATTEFAVP